MIHNTLNIKNFKKLSIHSTTGTKYSQPESEYERLD